MAIDKINDLSLHNGAIRDQLAAALLTVLDSGWFALGPHVTAFEQQFAAWCGAAHCLGVANGTDAIELVLRGIGVQAGDEVITVANAGFYSSTAILAIGAVPVYADIDASSLLLSAAAAEACITKRTRAIIVTHLFGQMADMKTFCAMAKRHDIGLVEDCAQAHGAMIDGCKAGSIGHAAAFSFYPTKNLGALGDGGAVVTSDDVLVERIRRLRQYGWQKRYTVTDTGGRNSRLDEIQAALLSVKLRYLDAWNIRRREIAQQYNTEITNTAVQKPLINDSDYVAHLYVIRTQNRDALRQYLHERGIASDVHYPLLDYQQPAVSRRYSHIALPVSEAAAKCILTLPCYPEMTTDEVRKVSCCINEWQP